MTRKRERMRARGPRGTHALVQMVREQVAVLVESTGRLAGDMNKMAGDMRALGALMNALASVSDDHEARIVALEKPRKGKR